MKKLLMILALVMLPLSMALATDYYFVIDTGIDLTEDDSLKMIGKPAIGTNFGSLGNCDGGTDWPAGHWDALSYVAVEAQTTKSSRLGEAYFATSGISKGDNLDSLDDLATSCSQDIVEVVHTFDKWSGQVN